MMSKVAKWKLEKTKVKVVFRLQFHATHVPKPGWDKLFVAFIPADSGKATAKTTKANVRNGTCKWSDPIYETARLLQDIKTKQYDEKLYKLLVGMGTSRSSILGEAYINLADYIDASEPSSVALPLQGCSFDTILHVTVQLLTSKTRFREFEMQTETRERKFQSVTDQSTLVQLNERAFTSLETAENQTEKAIPSIQLKSEYTGFPTLEEERESNKEYSDSGIGIDASSTSESFSAEKYEASSIYEFDSLKSTVSQELNVPSHCQSNLKNEIFCESNEWVHRWNSNYAVDIDEANVHEHNSRLRGSLAKDKSSVVDLKVDVSSLQSQANALSFKPDKFLEQSDMETTSGDKIAGEVSLLKWDYSRLRHDPMQLTHLDQNFNERCRNLSSDSEIGLDENKNRNLISLSPNYQVLSEEGFKKYQAYSEGFVEKGTYSSYDLHMRWLHGLSLVGDNLQNIQNKVGLIHDERDMQLFCFDLNSVKCAMRDIEQEMSRAISQNVIPLDAQIDRNNAIMQAQKSENLVTELSRDNVSQNNLETASSDAVSQENQLALKMMKEEIFDLQVELKESKAERENLLKKMSHMESYYKDLIHEREEKQKQVLVELENLRNEHSTCLNIIPNLKNQLEKMHEDMTRELLKFAEERHELDALNKELGKRASASEASLKRVRQNYAIVVEQMQRDLERLSSQVLTMFKTNENLAKQAFAEASELYFQEYLDEHSEKQYFETQASFLKEMYRTRVHEIKNEMKIHRNTGKEMSLGDNTPRFHNRSKFEFEKEKLQGISETENHSLSTVNYCRGFMDVKENGIHSNSVILKEHFEYNNPFSELSMLSSDEMINVVEMNRLFHLQKMFILKRESEVFDMDELNIHSEIYVKVLYETLKEANNGLHKLTQELNQSDECKEELMIKMQYALNEVEYMKEIIDRSSKRCDELTFENRMLESNLQSISDENHMLHCKVLECESLITQYETYKNEYSTCYEKRFEAETLLEQEISERNHLQIEITSMTDNLNNLKAELDRELSLKDELTNTVSFMQTKLGNLLSLMIFHSEQMNVQVLSNHPQIDKSKSMDLSNTIRQLEVLEQEAYEKIVKTNQEKKELEKQRDSAHNLLSSTESHILMMKQQFESDLQDVMNKLSFSKAQEEKLLSEFENIVHKYKVCSEAERKYVEQIQVLSLKINDLEIEMEHFAVVKKLHAQETLKFEESKLLEARYAHENELLNMSLNTAKDDNIKLHTEINSLKESLRNSNLQLQTEKGLKNELQLKVTDLTVQLDEKQGKLLHSRQVIRDMETEKVKMDQLLLHSKERIQIADNDVSVLHIQVCDLEAYLLSSDVEIIFIKEEYQTRMSELLKELNSVTLQSQILELEVLDSIKKHTINSEAREMIEEKNWEMSLELENLKNKLQNITDQNRNLEQKALEFDNLLMEFGQNKMKILECKKENETLKITLQACNEKLVHLVDELSNLRSTDSRLVDLTSQMNVKDRLLQFERGLKEELQVKVLDLTGQMNEFQKRVPDLESEISRLKRLLNVAEENQRRSDKKASLLHFQLAVLEVYAGSVLELCLAAEIEAIYIRTQFQTRVFPLIYELESKSADASELRMRLQHFADEIKSRSQAEENFATREREMLSKLTYLEYKLQQIVSENKDLTPKALNYESVKMELENVKKSALDYMLESEILKKSLEDSIQKQIHLKNELNTFRERLENALDELESDKGIRKDLQVEIINLSSLLSETQGQLMSLEEHKAELFHLRQKVSDLQLEKLEMKQKYLHQVECQRETNADVSLLRFHLTNLESHVMLMHGYLLKADIELICTRNGFEDTMKRHKISSESEQKLTEQNIKMSKILSSMEHKLQKTTKENNDLVQTIMNFEKVQMELERAQVTVFETVQENAALQDTFSNFKEEVVLLTDKLDTMKGMLICANNELKNERNQTEELSAKVVTLTCQLNAKQDLYQSFVDKKTELVKSEIREKEEMKHVLDRFEVERDLLWSARDEMETIFIVLRSKLEEHYARILLLEEYENDVIRLRINQSDLSNRLSEQILKTEEFRNLAVHLKELNDKANFDCLKATEREKETIPSIMQESLRIAFIREQCDTKLHEMEDQLHACKKHGEEMLLRFQNAVNDIEKGKKVESSLIRRNEELSIKLLELENELQKITDDRREKMESYNRVKSALECSKIDLDSCKEEQVRLEAYLKECNEERLKLSAELILMREHFKKAITQGSISNECYSAINSSRLSVEDDHLAKVRSLDAISQVNHVVGHAFGDRNAISRSAKYQDSEVITSRKSQKRLFISPEGCESTSLNESPMELNDDRESQFKDNHVSLVNNHFKENSLKSSMELIQKELERMKTDSLASIVSDNHFNSDSEDVQKEFSKLHMANEQLQRIFPSYSEFSGSDSAIERLLALEMEVAEALHDRKTTEMPFQCSLLKQHSNEEAIFQSFRDINELIKDMLELKKRHELVEFELKEMHSRYTQLSLQFAEVEGERQKLVMTLKNIRGPRRLSQALSANP